jgi:predicted transposase YdaD
MLHLPETDLKKTRFYQEVFDEGREEGREAAEVALLLRLLTRRLGTLSAEYPARLSGLSSDQRGALVEAVLDFTARSDLDTWLSQHPGTPPAH